MTTSTNEEFQNVSQTGDPRQRDGVHQYVTRPAGEYPWSIEAWDDGSAGGRFTLVSGPWGASLDETIARAERFTREGDHDGRLYDHVDIIKTTYRTCSIQETFSIEQAKANRAQGAE